MSRYHRRISRLLAKSQQPLHVRVHILIFSFFSYNRCWIFKIINGELKQSIDFFLSYTGASYNSGKQSKMLELQNRKYDETFLQFIFNNCVNNENVSVLAIGSMNPSKLNRNLESKHRSYRYNQNNTTSKKNKQYFEKLTMVSDNIYSRHTKFYI